MYQIDQSVIQYLSVQMRDKIKTSGRTLKLDGPYLLLAKSLSEPTLGDTRISFDVVKCNPVTVVAERNGDSFIPYDINVRRFSPHRREFSGEDDDKYFNSGANCNACDRVMEVACCCCCCSSCCSNLFEVDHLIDWVFEEKYSKHLAF